MQAYIRIFEQICDSSSFRFPSYANITTVIMHNFDSGMEAQTKICYNILRS